jgi:hypothetical protein
MAPTGRYVFGNISPSVYIVLFGKYRGKTLPETIVRDLDWFFWVVPKLYR